MVLIECQGNNSTWLSVAVRQTQQPYVMKLLPGLDWRNGSWLYPGPILLYGILTESTSYKTEWMILKVISQPKPFVYASPTKSIPTELSWQDICGSVPGYWPIFCRNTLTQATHKIITQKSKAWIFIPMHDHGIIPHAVLSSHLFIYLYLYIYIFIVCAVLCQCECVIRCSTLCHTDKHPARCG